MSYAWSDIKTGEKSVKTGDQVDAAKLGLDAEQFNQLVEAGSIRKEKYPDMGDFNGSPTEFAKRQLAELSGQLDDDDDEDDISGTSKK